MLRWLRTILGKPTHHGSAGWQDPPPEFLIKRTTPLTAGSFFLSHCGRNRVVLPRMEALRHGVIVGGSGSGKSRGFMLPNAAWQANASIVCTDPKSELWKHTSGLHRQAIRYAPTNPDNSACFNWIPLCREPRISELAARAIVESGNTSATEQVWIDMESAFLSGLFSHTATLSEPTPLSAYRLFTRQSTDSLIRVLLQSPSDAAREQAMVFSQTQERMRGSIVPVVAAKLQFMRDPNVARFTSASCLAPDFARLRASPMALYWCLREADISRLKPLTSVFFTLLLEELARHGEGGEGVPVTLLLDEFANCGVIPNFETTIAIARGRGVSLWLGIQAISQLEARYGKANAQTILANTGTKIALAGLDVESAEYFSRSLGEETASVRKLTRHGTLSASMSYTKDEHARRLMTPDEIRRLRSNEFIAIVGNQKPMKLTKHFYAEEAREKSAVASLGEPLSVSVTEQTNEPPKLPDFQDMPRRRTTRPPLSPGKRSRVSASAKSRAGAT